VQNDTAASSPRRRGSKQWIPASAGMTEESGNACPRKACPRENGERGTGNGGTKELLSF
jgi:hypothetical protein